MPEGQNKRQVKESKTNDYRNKNITHEDFVLEKTIFYNVFEEDIRRVYLYKKVERIAKAIHLIGPAFVESPSLKSRIDTVAIKLIDGAIVSNLLARTALARELLALLSLLAIARSSSLLSAMNVDIITNEARTLLKEILSYEDPRLPLDEISTLSTIAKHSHSRTSLARHVSPTHTSPQGQEKDNTHQDTSHTIIKDRREIILSIIGDKRQVSIKDISTLVRDISEKTVQRELQSLINEGLVVKQGERRWSLYSLAV